MIEVIILIAILIGLIAYPILYAVKSIFYLYSKSMAKHRNFMNNAIDEITRVEHIRNLQPTKPKIEDKDNRGYA